MARLTTVMADYFRSRLNGLSGLVGLAIGASRSPELTTTTHRLTRRLSVEVLLGALGVSVRCVLVTELVAFAMSTDSNEGLRQVSGLLGGLCSLTHTLSSGFSIWRNCSRTIASPICSLVFSMGHIHFR